MPLEQLEGRVAVVTGAASGIGLAMATAFAAEGMRVVLSDIETGPLDAAVDTLRAEGRDVLGVQADVASWPDVEALAEATVEAFGGVHVVCNNAGVVKRARTWALTLDDWSWVLGVDLWGVIHGVKAFVPRMLEQGEGGHVVNTASMVGLLPVRNLATYDAAKMAVVGLSEALAMDLEDEGSDIGVSVLLPGFIATRITDSARNRPLGPRRRRGGADGRPHHGGRRGDDGGGRGRRPRARCGADRRVLDPHPRRVPAGHPGPRRGRRRRWKADATADLVDRSEGQAPAVTLGLDPGRGRRTSAVGQLADDVFQAGRVQVPLRSGGPR